ncbi:flavin reductase (NADPH) [Pocillopora verrucosa]|uniref:flavin reductase (NADPH) n=1 Tax=Pocillopora verrucosa TaxID=203993 RepID=UPI0027974740|nr:flavin reductase (NADPH)-like [Pocillopora verrucosa]
MAAELLFPKLVIFGASGPTGRHLVQQALNKGHLISAVVRSPDKFDIRHEKLEVIKGDVFDSESLNPILQDKDAVLSCLGAHGTSVFKHTTLYSESMKSISAAMERSNVDRLVCVTSWGTQKEPGNPKLMEYLLKPLMMAGFIHDMALMERMLMETKLNYTVVRPPGLKNGPAKGDYSVQEGQIVPNTSWFIPRADVADFMLSSLNTPEWDRKCVAIGSKS